MADALVTQLARALNLPPDAAQHTLNRLVTTLREQIDATGQAEVPGLGTFHRDDDRLTFAPDETLARTVNHRYAGLRPIEASPSLSAPEPETEDPFAAEITSSEELAQEPYAFRDLSDETTLATRQEAAEPEEAEAEPPEPLARFQPLDALLESGHPEPTEETEQKEPEPPAEPEPLEPAAVEDQLEEDDQLTLDEEDELTPDEQHEIDALLAGTWTSLSETPDEEHPLGPMPPDQLEDAEYSVLGPEEEAEPAVESEEAAALENQESPFEEAAEPPALAVDPSPVTEPPTYAEPTPEPTDAPAKPRVVAPAVAVTAATAPDREPAETRGNGGGNVRLLALAAAVLLLGIVALLWFLNREPTGPTVAERGPIAADTVAAVPPAAVDTAAAVAPMDTAAVIEAPPDPAEPAPPPDPLRAAEGIDPAAGGWTWVVASEVNRATAERRAAQYRSQGLRADVIPSQAQGSTRYRVGLGQFATTTEANRYRPDLPADVPEGTWLLQL